MTGIETALIVSTVVSAAAAAVGTVSAVSQAKNQQAMYQYNAKLNEQNAQISRQQAAYNEQQTREQYKRAQAQQEASILGSGGTLSGSALDLIDDTRQQGSMEALTQRYQGELQAQSNLSSANVNRFNASASGKQAGTILASGLLQTGATVAGGIYEKNAYLSNKALQDSFNNPQKITKLKENA